MDSKMALLTLQNFAALIGMRFTSYRYEVQHLFTWYDNNKLVLNTQNARSSWTSGG